MFNMAHNNVNNTAQGFYVFQPALGAPLEFHPALGTPELDEMMDAYVASFAPIQDKRAAISLDFFEHLSLTGETIKFYPISIYSMASATSSPASLQDSGYSSSFSASPLAPTWNWGQVAQAPSASFSSPQSRSQPRQHHAATAAKSTLADARSRTSDFSHLPGMKILTKDGRDVTNAASRGSKTKEQRDHAHLMRIIKACDSCRRKKIRCDPSHKTRETLKSRSLHAPKALASTRHAARKSRSERPNPLVGANELEPATTFMQLPVEGFDMFDGVDVEAWNDLVHLDQPLPAPFVPDDYDFINDPDGLFGPVSDTLSSSSPASAQSTPTSPDSASTMPISISISPNQGVLSSRNEVATRQPRLPYLDGNTLPHEYIDFNLYSPASSLADDELPVFAELSSHNLDTDIYHHKPSNIQDGICSGSGTIGKFNGFPSTQPSQLASSARRPSMHSATPQSSSQAATESNALSPTAEKSISQTRTTPQLFSTQTRIVSSLLPVSATPGSVSRFESEVVSEESQREAGHFLSTATDGDLSTSEAPVLSPVTRLSDAVEIDQVALQDAVTRTATTTQATMEANTVASTSTLTYTGRSSSCRAYRPQNSDLGRLPNTLGFQTVFSVTTRFDDPSWRANDSIGDSFSSNTFSNDLNQHSPLLLLQSLAAAFIAVICLRGEKSSLSRTLRTNSRQTIMLPWASALAVGVLFLAIAALNHRGLDILGLKDSLLGVAFCFSTVVMSRSTGKNGGEGEAARCAPSSTHGIQEASGVADDGDVSSAWTPGG